MLFCNSFKNKNTSAECLCPPVHTNGGDVIRFMNSSKTPVNHLYSTKDVKQFWQPSICELFNTRWAIWKCEIKINSLKYLCVKYNAVPQSILILVISEGINYWRGIPSGQVSSSWIILAFTIHIYNYRAELDMTDKSRENVFSPFMKYISHFWVLTEYIPVTSPSSLDYVIKFRWSTFIHATLCKYFEYGYMPVFLLIDITAEILH